MTAFPKPLLMAAGICLGSISQAENLADAYEKIPSVTVEELIPHMTPLEGTTPAQWRVIWNGDASREATISWSTKEKGSKHLVYYRTGTTSSTQTQECQANGEYSRSDRDSDDTALFYHHARLTGLKPDTTYHFVMESDGERSKTLHFSTAPESGTGFSIIHGGDSRTGLTNRCRMNLLIGSMAHEDEKILAFAHGGDYITKGHRWEQWRTWLSQHELTTTPEGRVLPIIPTWGNHDKGDNYFEIFDLDKQTERWHTTRLGEDVALVTLDTNSPGGGEQAEFLEAQLSKLRPETRWLLVQYHRPLYPAVKGPKGHKAIFTPLFDKYNVDIALESDGHCMKRTVPIRGDKKDPTGIIYVGEGGLGVGQRQPETDRWYIEDGGKAGSGHHIMRLDFTDDTLRNRFIRMNGEVWDDLTLKAR